MTLVVFELRRAAKDVLVGDDPPYFVRDIADRRTEAVALKTHQANLALRVGPGEVHAGSGFEPSARSGEKPTILGEMMQANERFSWRTGNRRRLNGKGR